MAARPDSTTGRICSFLKSIVEVALFVAICVAFFCVLGLIVHLVFGGDTSPRDILVGGLRLFGVALTIAMVVFFVGRWVYWLVDRRIH
jgi:hypothetical protein